MKEPVDAVITWVDGRDSSHRAKLNAFLNKHNVPSASAAPTRFNQVGEIKYCIYSILHFAPWVRKIFLVTDQQTPPIYEKLPSKYKAKLEIVDHTTLFSNYAEHLPTFNSISIETLIWRIPNLANQFIYFNDDVFLLKPIDYTDFFYQGRIAVRGEWKNQHHKKIFARFRKKKTDAHRIFQEKMALFTGFTSQFLHLPHVPFALEVNFFKQLYYEHRTIFEKNLIFRFRDESQFWPISLFYHALLKQNKGFLSSNLQGIMINPVIHKISKIKKKLNEAEKDKHIGFLCIQSLDTADLESYQYIINWLEQHIPVI
jgi:hypothetical protein